MANALNDRKLRDDALAIWQAGVDAVRPSRLLANKMRVEHGSLWVEDAEFDFTQTRKLVVIGAGKASAGLAIEFEHQIARKLLAANPRLQISGWINCPEGTFDAAIPLEFITLHAARPAGRNEPTENAIIGTQRILQLVRDCDSSDMVICLLSGGGSALLTAPSQGITLNDKQAVARLIASAGGNIEQLNTVRTAISDIKGGGLARASNAGRLLTLIISDVLGDSLQTIASGPTVVRTPKDGPAALDVLRSLNLVNEPKLSNVVSHLRNLRPPHNSIAPAHSIEHIILGNNADAVDAAGVKAVELGYRYIMEAARAPEGDVMLVAEHASRASLQLIAQNEVDCWISGGEPTVCLPSTGVLGKGGRNQQLTLAVLAKLAEQEFGTDRLSKKSLAFVSGGTDGEDGPTDAAGAWCDAELRHRASQLGLDPQKFLREANAYEFFDQAGGLIRTGPTGTNVCDLRVAVSGLA